MRALVRLVLLAIVVGVVAVAPATGVAASGDGTDLRAIGPDPVEPGFPMLAVGVVFELPAGRSFDVVHDEGEADHDGEPAIRFRHAGVWGGWIPLHDDGAEVAGQWASELVAADGADAYQVRDVPDWVRSPRAYAVALEPVAIGVASTLSTSAVNGCVTRDEWGAAAPRGTLASSPTLSRLQVITIHHTADSANSRTSAQWVRAIQGWHQDGRGWDDIGYQVLIDPSGVVFEGRWSGTRHPACRDGGTAVSFGHASSTSRNVVTGAHVGGWNTGNLGIALLGTFTSGLPTSAARDALVDHLGAVTARHDFDPKGTVTLTSGSTTRTVPRILGHRDLGSTECPGATFHAHLPTIRDRVASWSPTTPPVVAPAPEIALVTPSARDTTVLSPTEAGTHVAFSATLVEPIDGVTWRWNDGRGRPVASTASFGRVLGPGAHRFTVVATDPAGRQATTEVRVQVVPELLVDHAARPKVKPGRAVGAVQLVRDPSAGTLVLQERAIGRRAAATSGLDARFGFRVRGGGTVTLVLDADVPVSPDGDAFVVAYSTDRGRTFTDLGTLASGSSGRRTFALPSSLRGNVIVRIRDTDRTPGNLAMDELRLHHLVVESRTALP